MAAVSHYVGPKKTWHALGHGAGMRMNIRRKTSCPSCPAFQDHSAISYEVWPIHESFVILCIYLDNTTA